jgi:hypothetical protein
MKLRASNWLLATLGFALATLAVAMAAGWLAQHLNP